MNYSTIIFIVLILTNISFADLTSVQDHKSKHRFVLKQLDEDLLTAVIAGDKAKVEKLIKQGANVNIKNRNGSTPLQWGCSIKNLDIVKLLINNGAYIHNKDSFGLTPLHEGAYSGYLEVVVFLIEKGADIHDKDKAGRTSLHWAVWGRNVKMVQFIIDKGAEVNAKNNAGKTPLDFATGNDQIFKLLKEHGAKSGIELQPKEDQ